MPDINQLNAIFLPLNETQELLFLDNLEAIVNEKSNISRVQAYHFFPVTDEFDSLNRIATQIEEAKVHFPDDEPVPEVSDNYKKAFWSIAVSYFTGKTPVLDIPAKAYGEMATAGAVAGGAAGIIGGPPGMIVGALTGGLLGYTAPLLIAGKKWHNENSRFKKANNQNELNTQVQEFLDEIAQRIRYNNLTPNFEVLPDFINDNIGQYLLPDTPTLGTLRTGTSPNWVYKAFQTVMKNPDVVSRMPYATQWYYFNKSQTVRVPT
tara:strand:+ start:8078 stop:8869 length:792 start_codon:yes stop_codon:yes gene_type:complete